MASIRAWWHALGETPEPLGPGEKLGAWAVSILVALSRWPALSLTPWDWDEALFMLGLRAYDVRAHHPHPPGFPLYIGAAKLFEWAGLSEFHALQALSLLAAVAIVPATFFLCRELRLPFATSLTAGVFLAFFPNVWFFGGTALSDVPSMTLSIVAAALLLRGCRSDRAYYGGALLLGVAAGFRPQNLAIGFAPALIASAYGLPRRWRRLAVATVAGAAVVAIAYGAAAQRSGGWGPYSETVHAHEQYISTVDSFHNPNRPPLWRLFPHFFVWPYKASWINGIVTLLVAVSLAVSIVRLRGPILAVVAAFGPFCLAAWLMLDHFSSSRFSIGYAPLFAVLAADGAGLLARGSRRVQGVIAAAVAAVMIVWTWPALREVHRHPSPTWAACAWVRAHHDPAATLYIHDSMGPFADAFLQGVRWSGTGESTPLATATSKPGDLFVIEAVQPGGNALLFTRPRGRIFPLVRDRYFEVSVLRLRQLITFAEGWYDLEGSGTTTYRWMGRQGRILLPPAAKKASLRLRLYVPLDAIKQPPTITIRLNGAVIDTIRATVPDLDRTWSVAARADGMNELVIETDRVVNPLAGHLSGDPRDLGVRLSDAEWGT